MLTPSFIICGFCSISLFIGFNVLILIFKLEFIFSYFMLLFFNSIFDNSITSNCLFGSFLKFLIFSLIFLNSPFFSFFLSFISLSSSSSLISSSLFCLIPHVKEPFVIFIAKSPFSSYFPRIIFFSLTSGCLINFSILLNEIEASIKQLMLSGNSLLGFYALQTILKQLSVLV